MSIIEQAHRIEELQSDATRINSLGNALFIAIFHQDAFSITEYEEAYMLLMDLAYGLQKNLEKLTDEAFELLQGCKEKEHLR